MGVVRYLDLTHRDDVADHQKFHDHVQGDLIIKEIATEINRVANLSSG